MRIRAGMRRYRPNLSNRSDVIVIPCPQRFLDGLYRCLDIHLAQPGILQAFSGKALLYSVDLNLAEPLHHHVDTEREAERLDDVLEVEQRDVADNTTCRQQIDALDGPEREEPFFEILEDIHGGNPGWLGRITLQTESREMLLVA